MRRKYLFVVLLAGLPDYAPFPGSHQNFRFGRLPAAPAALSANRFLRLATRLPATFAVLGQLAVEPFHCKQLTPRLRSRRFAGDGF
jgi:hypothetical protein